MKKIIALLLSLVLVIGLVTGCGNKKDEESNNTTPTKAVEDSKDEGSKDEGSKDEGTTAAAAKTGLAVITSLGSSKAASAEGDGQAQIDSVVVAVLVGQDGIIKDCKIDTVQTKVKFSAEGKLLTDKATVVKSKQELGTEYGMLAKSGIGKEWNEQANALAAYVIGKTVDQVKGIALNEEGRPTDADLAASVTVHINDYIAGIDKAVANAQDLGASDSDKLGLGIYTDIAKSADATAEKVGVAQAYSYYTATTFNADGKITSSIIDASQGNVNFDTTGAITTDLTVAPQTKQELKEGYGMKGSSDIGKEWYEQANAFAAYVTGKTVEEVKGIALTEGRPADADLAASVTVHANSFIDIIVKASENAK